METFKIILTEVDAISSEDKAALKAAGYLVVEVPDPSKVIILNELESMMPNDLLMAALHGLNQVSSREEAFTKELYKRLKEKEIK